MAKGYPDYFGQSIWPKYGTMLIESDTITTIDNSETDVFVIFGVGVWTYMMGIIITTLSGGIYVIRGYIDGVLLFDIASGNAYTCIYNESDGAIIKTMFSDRENDTLYISLNRDIPFHDSVRVTMQRLVNINVEFDYSIGWYKVT